MKAIVVHEYGSPEVLKFEEYPDPVPGPGEVLVRVAAASVNPIDCKRRDGITERFFSHPISGADRSRHCGYLGEEGAGSRGLCRRRPGICYGDNTYAELCVINAAVL